MLLGALMATNTGLQAASGFLDVVSNNIANAGTTGFKTGQVNFQDLLYTGEEPGATAGQGQVLPTGSQVGSGAILSSDTGLFTQGGLNQTGGQFDLAINGNGFFAVTLADGTTGYTRAGNFTTNAGGQLVSADGFPLAGGITVPADASAVSIGSDGAVTATTPSGTQAIGQLKLAEFVNPGGLARVGNTTFAAGPNAGPPVTGTPGTAGLGTVTQGSLEQSNVQVNSELVNLLVAQRAFQVNTEAINIESQTLQDTTTLIS